LRGSKRFLLGILEALEGDAAARQTFQIMGFKCEYVGELERELVLQRLRCSELISKLTQTTGARSVQDGCGSDCARLWLPWKPAVF